MANIIRAAGGRFVSAARSFGRPIKIRLGGAARRAGAIVRRGGVALGRATEKGLGEVIGVEALPSAVGGGMAQLECEAALAMGLDSPTAQIAAPLVPAVGVYFLGNKATGKVRRLAFNVANAHVAVSAAKATAHFSRKARGEV